MTYEATAVDMDRLSEEIRQLGNGGDYHRTPVPSLPGPTREVPRYGVAQHNTLQVIGHAVTRLTWTEAERMGSGIQVKMKEGQSLAAAIQAWADEWEKFE